MRNIMRYLIVAALGVVLFSCATASREMQAKSISVITGVFTEAPEGSPQKGFVDLTITASIKTHLEGYHLLESEKSPDGKPSYPVVFNIDGQSVTWDMKGEKESTPKYDNDGKTSLDPEAGDGMKYLIEKEIRLMPGTHKIVFGLPVENYFIETEVLLKDGETYSLEFSPIYKYKTRPHRIPTFLKGIRMYEVFLNGGRIAVSSDFNNAGLV